MALYHIVTFWDLYVKIKILLSTLLSEQIDYCFIIFIFLSIVLSSVVHSKNPIHETRICSKRCPALVLQIDFLRQKNQRYISSITPNLSTQPV